VPERLGERGSDVTHAALRQWCLTCGQDSAQQLQPRRAPPGATWPLAEVLRTLPGERHALWRAVDQADPVRDRLGQSRRHPQAAQQCGRQLLTGLQSVPRGSMTEKWKSAGAAPRDLLPGVAHRQRRDLNKRGEHSQRPPRQRA